MTTAGGFGLGGLFASEILESEAELLATIREQLGKVANDMESYAQQNAPWDDQTGLARDTLTAEVQAEEGDEYIIVLYGEAPENLWLEIAMSQRFAIIFPTLELFGPQVMEAIAGAGGE